MHSGVRRALARPRAPDDSRREPSRVDYCYSRDRLDRPGCKWYDWVRSKHGRGRRRYNWRAHPAVDATSHADGDGRGPNVTNDDCANRNRRKAMVQPQKECRKQCTKFHSTAGYNKPGWADTEARKWYLDRRERFRCNRC